MSEPKKIKEIIVEAEMLFGKCNRIIYEDESFLEMLEYRDKSIGSTIRYKSDKNKLHREDGAANIDLDMEGKMVYAEWWDNGRVIASFKEGKLYEDIGCNPKREIKVICEANRYLNHPDYANVVDLSMVKNAVLAFENRFNNEDERPGLVQIEFSNVNVNKSENELLNQQQKIKEIIEREWFSGKYSKIIYDEEAPDGGKQLYTVISPYGREDNGPTIKYRNLKDGSGNLHREDGAAHIHLDKGGKVVYAEWWDNGRAIASFKEGKLYKDINCNPENEIKVLCTANRYLNHPDYANVVNLPMVKNAVFAFENRINNEDERPGLVQIEFSNVNVNKSENEISKQQQITSNKLNSFFSERRQKLGIGSEKSEEFELKGQGFKY